MKKIIVSIFVLLSVAVLTGCFEDINTLEWETLPKSVYQVNDMTAATFMIDVSIKIDGSKVTLQQAVDSYGAIVSGFDLSEEGDRVITVKYKSLTIYWAYKVGKVTPTTVTPAYGWYGDGTATSFTINDIYDLYGFANIVNGKRSKAEGGFESAYSFAGKTVKLGGDIDLTGEVWEPIGAAPRKLNKLLNFKSETPSSPANYDLYFDGGKLYFINNKGVKTELANSAEILYTILNGSTIKESYYIKEYVFAKEEQDGNYSYNEKEFNFYFSQDELVGNFFEGSFNGQGHKIKGLSDIGYTPTVVLTYANSGSIVSGYTFGLFGVVKGNVTMSNIIFENVQIIGAYYSGGSIERAELDSIGAAVGYTFGEGNIIFDNVKVLSGTISATHGAGGVAGRVYTYGNVLVQNCENHANITITEKHAGGIIGYTSSGVKYTFLNNINYGNMVAPKTRAGAMVAYIGVKNTENSITNCRNFGKIIGCSVLTGLGKGMVGMYGGNEYQQFNDCVNYGDVSN